MESTRDNPQSANVEAYLRDIKELLEKHYGEYVVYHDGQQILIAASKGETYYGLEERGLLGKQLTLIKKIKPLNQRQVEKLRGY
ncbi:MAG: hypothetical protein AABW91_04540 [Nanoarchaeota archaeon]